MHTRFTPFTLFSSLLLATQAMANPSLEPPSMAEVVVTATRTAQTVDETLAAVTVIGREEIERSGSRDLPELLEGLEGVTMVRNGGYGATSSLLLRGTNAGHLLVLVDGFKVGSATLGEFAWQHIPPALVERIEIVRGPRSSLYGSEAIGGVIQIFTRKQIKKGVTGYIETGVGSQGTQETSATLTGDDGTQFFTLTASRFTTNGTNAITPSSGQPLEPDDDGYLNRSFSARLGVRFPKGDLELSGMHATGESDYDDENTIEANTLESLQQTVGITLRLRPMDTLNLTASGSLGKDDTEAFSDNVSTSVLTTESSSLGLQGDLILTENQLITSGIDFRREHLSGTQSYDLSGRDFLGLFAQYQHAWQKHDFQIGTRWDDIEEVGQHMTYNLAWGYKLPHKTRLTASHGTAFKAPTFNDLYWPGSGNPELKPEKSLSWEVGLSGLWEAWHWSVRAFQTEIKDLINWAPAPTEEAPWRWIPDNIGATKIPGVETTLKGRFQAWDVGLGLTWMDPENEKTGKRLTRRPTQQLKLDLDRPFMEKARFGLTWQLQNPSFEDSANEQRLAGFGVVHLRSEYALDKDWVVKATVRNLLDRAYQTAGTFGGGSYKAPGRSIMVNLGWHWGDTITSTPKTVP